MAIAKPNSIPQRLQTKLDYDSDGNLIYVGKSLENVLVSEPAWQILKLAYTDGNVVSAHYANGSHGFDYVWDSRVSYTYA